MWLYITYEPERFTVKAFLDETAGAVGGMKIEGTEAVPGPMMVVNLPGI